MNPPLPSQADRAPGRAHRWPTLLWGAALVLLVAGVYGSTLRNDFILDDRADISNNLAIRTLPGVSNIWFRFGTVEQYYPLTYSTFALEYWLWGLDPRGFHLDNVLLHALAAVLVWRLLLRLECPGAWLAAAIFAVHPIAVESVAWANERKNLLSLDLALGALLAYLAFAPPALERGEPTNAPRRARFYYFVSFALFAAALLSKTVTASVPAVLLVIIWWKQGRLTWNDARRTVPFFLLGLAMSIITILMETSHVNGIGASGPDWELSLVEQVLIAGRALWFYVGKLLWPYPLILFYPRWTIDAHQWWQFAFPLAALSALICLWLARSRVGRAPLAAALVFVGVLLPGLSFFKVYMFRYTFVADHIQYQASIALIALAAAGVTLAARRLAARSRWPSIVLCVGLLFPLVLISQQRTHAWRDDLTLWRESVARDPGLASAHSFLAYTLQHLGAPEEALDHFRQAIRLEEQLSRAYPAVAKYQSDVATTYSDMSLILGDMGRPADSESALREAIALHRTLLSDYPAATTYQSELAQNCARLAFFRERAGARDEAEALYREAIQLREQLVGDNPSRGIFQDNLAASHADLGLLLRNVGRTADAKAELENAAAIREALNREHPGVVNYQANLAASYQDLAVLQKALGRPADAAPWHAKELAVRESLARAHPTISKFQNDLAAGYVDLALTRRSAGQLADAERLLHKAIGLREKLVQQDSATPRFCADLAWCYAYLAATQFELGQTGEAEAACRKAIALREQLARDYPDTSDYKQLLAVSYRDLGALLVAEQQTGPAMEAFEHAVDLRRQLALATPDNPQYRSQLASELVVCAEAQAAVGRWTQSANRWAEAVAAGDDSWQTVCSLALTQLAAGAEGDYQATCAQLIERYASIAGPGTGKVVALTVVSGQQPPATAREVLLLAKRLAAAEPANSLAQVTLGAAQFRHRRNAEAIATLTAALAASAGATSPTGKTPPTTASVGVRVIGEAVLSLAYQKSANREAMEAAQARLRAELARIDPVNVHDALGLPPTIARCVVEIARQQLAKLEQAGGSE